MVLGGTTMHDGDNMLQGRVLRRAFLGDTVEAEIECGGVRLHVALNAYDGRRTRRFGRAAAAGSALRSGACGVGTLSMHRIRASSGLGVSPSTLALALVLTGALVLGPLVVLVRTALTPAGELPFETSTFTGANIARVFTSADLLVLLVNTTVYAAGSMIFGVALAVALAWLTERSDMPLRTLTRVALFTWMAVPPVVLGFGWILLINPGNGLLNALADQIAGVRPFTIYSMWALVVVTGFSVAPTAFVMIGGLLRNMDPQLESAGLVHGAAGVTVLGRITLPLLTPGLASIGIYMLIAVVQAFELPLIVGLTARIPVLSTRIYLLATPDTGVPNYGLAAAFGLVLLALAVVLMAVYFRMTRDSERFRTVTGKAFRPRVVALGAWRFAAAAGVMLMLFVMLMPLLILFWTSFLKFYQLPGTAALGSLTLDTYRNVLALDAVRRGAINTVILVFGASAGVLALGLLVSWVSARAHGLAARILDVLAFAPTAIPPIVMAVAILLLYLRTPLYGTMIVLVIGHITIYLAFVTRTLTSALMQLHKDLANAALVSGAGGFTVLRRVILPLIRPQVVNAWLWVLAHSARDLTIPVMLMTADTMVASSVMWTMWDVPDLPGAAAVACLLVAALLCIVAPLQWMASRAADRMA